MVLMTNSSVQRRPRGAEELCGSVCDKGLRDKCWCVLKFECKAAACMRNSATDGGV